MVAADVFTRSDVELKPDHARTLIRLYSFGYPAAFDRKPTRTPEDGSGALLHKRPVLLPYAISDKCSAFLTGSDDGLLSVMEYYG